MCNLKDWIFPFSIYYSNSATKVASCTRSLTLSSSITKALKAAHILLSRPINILQTKVNIVRVNMGDFGATLVVSFQFSQFDVSRNGHLRGVGMKFHQNKKQNLECFAAKGEKSSILSLRFSSFYPFSEFPGARGSHSSLSLSLSLSSWVSWVQASFDQYIEDQPRLLGATFPGKSENLNKDDWRVQMPPLQLLFLTVFPVADIRLKCRSNGKDYPFDIPHHISKVLELQMIGWELRGVSKEFMPSNLIICLKGALYAERRRSKSVLRNQMVIDVSFAAPTAIAFLPEDFIQGLAEKALKRMVEKTRSEVTKKLLLDYSKFTKEKQNGWS